MRPYTNQWRTWLALACLGALGMPSIAVAAPGLAAAARAAKQQFKTPTAADLVQAKVAVVAAAERLQKRFDDADQSADGWKTYLEWPKAQAALAVPITPDKTILARLYGRLAEGHDGLGLVWFVDLRQALETYLNLANALELKDLKPRYEASMEALAKRLEAYEKAPTPDDARWIGDVVRWIDDIGQAPELVRQVRSGLRQSNLFVEVSAKLVDAGVGEPVDETEQVYDCILGTTIHGTARMTGQLHAQLEPCADQAVIDTLLIGSAASDNVGFNGPATIWSNGLTQIGAVKRLWVDGQGWSSHPAASNATTATEITGLAVRNNNKLIERVAWKQVWKKKCQAEAVASLHAEQRVNARVDKRAEGMLAENNERYQTKLRKPLEDRKLFPELLQFSTSKDALHVQALEAGPVQLAAASAPPALPVACDLTVRVHESMINNAARSALGGMIVREERLRENVKELLDRVPDELKPDSEKEPWGINFAGVPITVAFADGAIHFTMRGMAFAVGEKLHPGMNVTAKYKVVSDAQGCKAVRQGELEIVPPDFAARKGRGLKGEEVAIRTLLAKRFDKILKPEMPLEALRLEGPMAKIGALEPATWSSKAGWLTIGYKIGAAKPAPAKPAPAKVASR